MSNAASHLSFQVYHEKETKNPSDRLLLIDKQVGQFWVKCSKALLNCILQRNEFRSNIKIKINSHQLESVYNKLKLYQHFKIQELNNWVSSKADLFGSILAVSETLASRNIYLSPVEDVTYTSLVVKPTGYLCLIEEGWVVLRVISQKWYLLDTRNSSASLLTDTYLHLIIKQILNDKGLIFQITGGEFSQLLGEIENENRSLRTRSTDVLEKDYDTAATSSSNLTRLMNPERTRFPDRNAVALLGEGISEPKPPDISSRYRLIGSEEQRYMEPRTAIPSFHQERREEVARMLFDLTKLRIGSIINRPGRPQVRRSESNIERSRSEVRQGPSSSSNRSNITVINQAQTTASQQPRYNDVNWPPLDPARQRPPRRRRARSSPRVKPNQSNQQYSPPSDSNDSTKSKERAGRSKTSKPEHQNQISTEFDNLKPVEDESTCCICLELKPDHVLYPCGHQCLCSGCKEDFLKRFNECPFCKRKVTDAIRIYKT